MSDLAAIYATYAGSNGDATKALYDRLEALGPAGAIAVNLFRACKSSGRAKVYRGGERGRGSYRSMAYGRKEWAMENLCAGLAQHAGAAGIARWGWAEDPAQPVHKHILYVDLPTGQVSFHTAARGEGPDYAAPWDGVRDASAGRICSWCARLFDGAESSTPAGGAPALPGDLTHERA